MYVKHSARSADRLLVCVFCLLIRPPPPSTLFPYTTLFRSSLAGLRVGILDNSKPNAEVLLGRVAELLVARAGAGPVTVDRKSTRLNSSHVRISYAVFCLKKKKRINIQMLSRQTADNTALRR